MNGRLHSQQLALDLVVEGDGLRLYDSATEERLPLPQELADQAVLAEHRAHREAEARQQAEAELRRLREHLDALRRPSQSE